MTENEALDLEARLSSPQQIRDLFRLLLPGDQYDLLINLFSELPIDKQQEWMDEMRYPQLID